MPTLPPSLIRLFLFVILLITSKEAFSQAPDGESVLRSLITANDALVNTALGSDREDTNARAIGEQVMTFAAAYSTQPSKFYRDPQLIAALSKRVAVLGNLQRDDGLFDLGNLDSPPDSAFVLKTLARGQFFLTRQSDPATENVRSKLKELILKTAEGVRLGGIHTPNHRWAICSALAQVYQLYPNDAYLARIDQWLAEGLDNNAEGEWSERSPNYNAHVNNPSILEVSVLLKRPQLLEAVRKNLEMSLYYVENNGEFETVASRRQDQEQGYLKYVWEYYVPYRYLAVLDQNPRFAAISRRIEKDFLTELGKDASNMSSALVSCLEFPEMLASMPPDAVLPTDYAKIFKLSGVARIRRENITATIFGGNDWHLGLGAGSGLSTNPTFFKFRKGAAILESIRLTPQFFNVGFFYPQSLEIKGENQYELKQVISVPYHQPLPAALRKPDGNYPLIPDGRIFFRLDYGSRKQDLKTLTTKVSIRENHGAFELDFDVQGLSGVPIVLELCFRKDGTLEGVESMSRPETAADTNTDNFFLKKGLGTYTVGKDQITFGPGSFTPTRIRMEGLEYANYKGRNRAEGYRVYLTATTPFHHTLTLK